MYIFHNHLLYKQGSTRQEKNLSNSSPGQRNAKELENFSSDPICYENLAAAIEKKVTVDFSTLAHFCVKDTTDIC